MADNPRGLRSAGSSLLPTVSPSHPFAPPLASLELASPAQGVERLHRIAAARRGVESALNASLCAGLLGGAAGAAWLPTILCAVLAIRATLALHSALGDAPPLRALSVAALLVPLVNLVAMAALCARASRRLRARVHELPPFDPLRR